jgi:hypothetical protein
MRNLIPNLNVLHIRSEHYLKRWLFMFVVIMEEAPRSTVACPLKNIACLQTYEQLKSDPRLLRAVLFFNRDDKRGI